jgi:hypothetical protein
LEAHFFTQFIGHHPIFHFRGGQIGFAILIGQRDKNNNTGDDVDNDAAHHDDEALPGRFSPELIRFRRFTDGGSIQRFIDHAGDLHKAAKGNSPDHILCFSYLLT